MANGINFVTTPNPGPSTRMGHNTTQQSGGAQPTIKENGSPADAARSRFATDDVTPGVAGGGGAGSVGNGYKPFGSLR